MSAREIPTLVELSAWGEVCALAYYSSGFAAGLAEGRREAEVEATARWAGMRAHVRMIAATPSYADLAERRGEPDRADRQRAILRERGIVA